jgi:hypothetical protein
MMTTANEIVEGDMLPALDNAYVFETGQARDIMSFHDGGMLIAVPSSLVYIGFHDAEGNENYLLVNEFAEFDVEDGE